MDVVPAYRIKTTLEERLEIKHHMSFDLDGGLELYCGHVIHPKSDLFQYALNEEPNVEFHSYLAIDGFNLASKCKSIKRVNGHRNHIDVGELPYYGFKRQC